MAKKKLSESLDESIPGGTWRLATLLVFMGASFACLVIIWLAPRLHRGNGHLLPGQQDSAETIIWRNLIIPVGAATTAWLTVHWRKIAAEEIIRWQAWLAFTIFSSFCAITVCVTAHAFVWADWAVEKHDDSGKKGFYQPHELQPAETLEDYFTRVGGLLLAAALAFSLISRDRNP